MFHSLLDKAYFSKPRHFSRRCGANGASNRGTEPPLAIIFQCLLSERLSTDLVYTSIPTTSSEVEFLL